MTYLKKNGGEPHYSVYNQVMPKPAHDLQVHRPNILVADMERALRVYRDILGFKVKFLEDRRRD